MNDKREKTIAYRLMILLFLVGVVCYAAFPAKALDEPVRVMLQSAAGKVLFDHKIHAGVDDFGFDCIDCHHELEEPEQKAKACGGVECHEPAGKDPIKREEAFHQQCTGCHEEDGTGPVECYDCHVPL